MIGKIQQKSTIATNTLSIIFTLAEPLKFQAGQFFFLELKNPPFTDERGNSRHFTIVNNPENEGIIEMATRLSDSAFKKSLASLPIGSEVEINGPAGNFLLPDSKEIIMIAGGIGITPFISQLRHIRAQKSNCQITLLYFNRDSASTAFFEELKNLEQTWPGFQLIPVMSADKTWPGEQGVIRSELVKKYSAGFSQPVFMVAGPPAMVQTTLSELAKISPKPADIKTEKFTGYENY